MLNEEKQEALHKLAELRFKGNFERVTARDNKLFTLKAWLKHVVGWHTWLNLEVWDLEQMSIQYDGRICYVCHAKI